MRDQNGNQVVYCSAQAYGIALIIEKHAFKHGRDPLAVTHEQIKLAKEMGSDEGRKLMLAVYEILVARHCTDGNVSFVWLTEYDNEEDRDQDDSGDGDE